MPVVQRENMNSTDKPLNNSQIRRGVYLNTGSKDVGVDKDWDFETYTWRGRRAGDPPRPTVREQDPKSKE